MVSILVPYFGSNRLLASHAGEAMKGCNHVAVPFAGGMPELQHMDARTIVVNDLNRWVVNLARCVASDILRPALMKSLKRLAFHPDELKDAQEYCNENEPHGTADINAAMAYFVACWMSRSGNAGATGEFKGGLAIRWDAAGGDSAVRYHSAIRFLGVFSRTLGRCTFSTLDAFEFLAKCHDADRFGIYSDSPFPGAGRKYKHNCGSTDEEEEAWHTRLRDALVRFEKTKVVCRFYQHDLVRRLYPEDRWEWRLLTGGKKQSNAEAPEVLLVSKSRSVE